MSPALERLPRRFTHTLPRGAGTRTLRLGLPLGLQNSRWSDSRSCMYAHKARAAACSNCTPSLERKIIRPKINSSKASPPSLIIPRVSRPHPPKLNTHFIRERQRRKKRSKTDSLLLLRLNCFHPQPATTQRCVVSHARDRQSMRKNVKR